MQISIARQCLIFSIMVPLFSFANQQTIDSLLGKLRNYKSPCSLPCPDDSVKIKLYNATASEIIYNNPDSGIVLALQAARLAQKVIPNATGSLLPAFCYFAGHSLYHAAFGYFIKNDYDRAFSTAGKSMKYYRLSGDSLFVAGIYSLMGSISRQKGMFDEAINLFLLALNIQKTSSSKNSTALTYNRLGMTYGMMSEYEKSIYYLLEALKLCEETGNRKGAGTCLHNIGNIHKDQGNLEKALEFFRNGLKIDEELGDKWGISASLNSIGNIYLATGDFSKAEECFLKNHTISSEIGDKDGVALALNNLGSIYFDRGENLRALESFKQSLAIRQEIDDKLGMSSCYYNIGRVMIQDGKYNDAQLYALQALAIARQTGARSEMSQAYGLMSECDTARSDFRSALENIRICNSIKDTILNETTTRQITEMQTKYESDKKEKEITILKKEKEIQNSEVRRQKLMRNSFIGASSLTLLLALLLYNRYLIKRRANLQLAEQNEKISMQKSVIEEQKQNITDSIEYASNIQKTMLPTDDEFNRLFPEAFILYKPRDIVSGDFYWVVQIEGGKAGMQEGMKIPTEGGNAVKLETLMPSCILVTADCTGHGVPGAFMSMLCTALLNEAVNDKGLIKPNEIFEEVRKGIIAALKQRGQAGGSKDGMDATIIALGIGNVKTPNPARSYDRVGVSTLHATCANNPIYIVSNGSLTEIPPDRFPVGIYEGEQKPFSFHETAVQKGDMIYTMTDGFEDQLGGEKGKKFKSTRLKELFTVIAATPIPEQKEILEKTFEEWKGTGEQTDDVTIIGIRI